MNFWGRGNWCRHAAAVYETVGGASDVAGLATDGDLLGRAVKALERLGDGTCTAGEVAAIAAEVIKNPPAVMRAAQRYLGTIGQAHEGAAAVELLRLVLEAEAAGGPSVDSRSGEMAE